MLTTSEEKGRQLEGVYNLFGKVISRSQTWHDSLQGQWTLKSHVLLTL